jgi:hypothetical protein
VAIGHYLVERFSQNASVPDGIGAFRFFFGTSFFSALKHAGSADLNFAARHLTV